MPRPKSLLPRPENPLQYRLALRQQMPAEALTQHDRGLLVRHLHGQGLSLAQIADCTRETALVVLRIARQENLPVRVQTVRARGAV